MRRVRISVAMRPDGYIAGPNGESDRIVVDPEIDFRSLMGSFDTLLIGPQDQRSQPRQGR